ncbi:MAG: hypothetical protein OXC26_01110 [Albidovulum sp.]|nr:hypothetical protein [Albidovulum sp.]
MKLLIKEYLSALKERGELDAILPDLLSELGFHVYSKPSIFVRQHGVDLAAVGYDDKDKRKKVFLFSVKAGDLTRNDWDAGTHALRPSLNEIIDSYIPDRIPKEYRDLPIAICICVGGDIRQDVDADLRNYIKKNTCDGREFQQWDGDFVANLMLSGILGENVISGEARSLFRKTVALIDEPDGAYKYFVELLHKLKAETGPHQKNTVTFVRQLNLCCWVHYVWSREARNLEASYRCSELAMLWAWDATSQHLKKSTAPAKAMQRAIVNLINLHVNIGNELITQRYLQYSTVRDGLSMAVNSSYSLDVNLRLFEAVGRLAATGIWLQFFVDRNEDLAEGKKENAEARLNDIANGLIGILNNNGALRTPIMDSHSVEVNLVCLFLALRHRYDAIQDWTGDVLEACIFALKVNKAYPCTLTEYHELAEHPQQPSDQDYFEDATAASTLFPTLCIWQKLADPHSQFTDEAHFFSENLAHCTFQLWVPNECSEKHLYTNSEIHGFAVVGLTVTETCDELLEIVSEECQHNTDRFNNLSAIRLGHWPILLAACRHHRIPVPLNFWHDLLDQGNRAGPMPGHVQSPT